MDYPLPPSKKDNSQIVLRKAITEALEGVLLRIPDLVAKAVGDQTSHVITETDNTLIKLLSALKDLKVEAPHVRVDAPRVTVETKDLAKGHKALQEAISGFQEAMEKQQSPEEALLALVQRMNKDKSLWFNVRMTDGKKFIDQFSDTIMMGFNTAGLAKDATIQSLLTSVLTVSGGVYLQPKVAYKLKQFGLSATGTIVAAVSNKRIKVYSIDLGAGAALGFSFRDGGAGNAVPGLLPFGANGGVSKAVEPPAYIFATSPGNSLDAVITTSGIGGWLMYWDEDAT